MSKAKKALVDVLKTLLFLGIGLLLIWLVVKNLSPKDKAEILLSFREAHPGVILLVMLLGLLSNVSRAIRWQIMIEPLGHKPSFINTLMAVLVGYLANLAVPRLGEVSRCGILNRYENLPVDKVLGTVVVERIMDMLLLMLVSVFTIIWQFDLLAVKLSEAYQNFTHTSSTNESVSIKTLLLISVLSVIAAFLLLRKKISRSKWFIKISGILKGFSEGIKTVTKLKKPYLFIFHSVFIWAIYFTGIYVGFKALPQTSILGIGAAFAILFFGTFAFILVQGGIGAYQIIVQNTLLIYGISANIGYAIGWIIWSSQTLMVIIFGLLSLVLLPIINKNKHGLSSGYSK